MSHAVLTQAFVYLLAAIVGVALARRLGLGAVLGYLIAGVAIGPFALGLVGREGGQVMHFAEFGVVMMLFVVGLELQPARLWTLRRPILGLGGAQVVGTALVVGALAMALGVAWKPALAIGLAFAMSSTAIVLSSLQEKGLLQSTGGQASFSVLLFQDIAVIPILAVFPLLGPPRAGAVVAAAGEHAAGAASRPAVVQAAMVLGAVAGVVLAGRLVVRPVFRLLAATRLREVFTAAALTLVVGVALLMELVGLSPALGTFLAGVALAESEYRHELESDIEPFKGLLLGLFFVSVGAQIDFAYVARNPAQVLALVAGTMAAKLAVLYALGRVFGLDRPARWLLAFGLAQVGEFAFVLLSFAVQGRVFTAEQAKPLVAAVALSMTATPLLFVALERFVLPRLGVAKPARAHETPRGEGAHVVIAGFGRFGQVVGRLLRTNGYAATVLDRDSDTVDLLRRLGHEVYYGDAARLDLLHAAGCERAALFVLAVDDPDQALAIARTVREHFPHVPIAARARNRTQYYALRQLGLELVVRETFGSALELGVASLRKLGVRAHTAERAGRRFRARDEAALDELEKLWGADDAVYFAAARRATAEAERLIRDEDPRAADERDAAWNNESLREEQARSEAGEAGE